MFKVKQLGVAAAIALFQNGLAKMRIIDTTKQYIAVDSIIAKPTNRVRVIVADASGCCASDVIAVATARPSAKAGPIVPKPVVRPAMMIETIAISAA